MSSSLIALILGAGPRVGTSVADSLAANGYKVAIVSRNGTGAKNDQGQLSLKADFSKPESIPGVFDEVKKQFGAAPSVVVYNAASLTPPPVPESVLSIPIDSVVSDLNVNVVSPYAAAQEAVKGWSSLSSSLKKLFIFTGNGLNEIILPVPAMLNLGTGKAGSAYWVGLADSSYKAQGYRFLYADERFADGRVKAGEIDGPAHGEFYSQLTKSTEGVPWQATFVKGKGYVSFK